MKSKILKIFIISILFLIMYYNKSYCVDSGTVRMQILPNDNAHPVWNNITVSESYDECLSLNSTTSTLGTDALRAHLVTNADWSAMAIFSISQYGGVKSNQPTWSNNNNSGVYIPIGYNYFVQTTGILDTVNSSHKLYNNFKSLIDENGNPKKYVKKWSINRAANNFVAFSDDGTYEYYTSSKSFGNNSDRPSCVMSGLFSVYFAVQPADWNITYGAKSNNVTFQPVIWN